MDGGECLMASYLTVAEADALAATLQPPVSTFALATTDAKTGALAEATRRIDAAYRYQGQRYMWEQELEFPRSFNGRLIDRDPSTGFAVVPEAVKLACIRQADSILRADEERIKAEDRIGLTAQSSEGLSESYATPLTPAQAMLCAYSRSLLEKYQARTGRLL